MTPRFLVAAFVLAIVTVFTSNAAQAQTGTPFAGHYRASGQAGWFLLHIQHDARVEVLMPGDGRRETHVPLRVRESGLSGVLATGEAWGIGRNFGKLLLSVGTQLFTLTPVAASDYAAIARAAQQQLAQQPAQQATDNGSLGGWSLSMAKSSNGGYFDARDYVFCSDGGFRLTTSVAGPGVASERKYAGRWRIDGASVRLQFNDGGARTLALRRVATDVIELGGVRYAARRASSCR